MNSEFCFIETLVVQLFLFIVFQNHCKEWAKTLDYKCSYVKGAVMELGMVLSATYEPKGIKTVEEPAQGV